MCGLASLQLHNFPLPFLYQHDERPMRGDLLVAVVTSHDIAIGIDSEILVLAS